jgi:hypothetical protein
MAKKDDPSDLLSLPLSGGPAWVWCQPSRTNSGKLPAKENYSRRSYLIDAGEGRLMNKYRIDRSQLNLDRGTIHPTDAVESGTKYLLCTIETTTQIICPSQTPWLAG